MLPIRPLFMRIAVLFALGATQALAQTYPTKPIRIIIAQAPGSATDVISRVVGNRLSEELGQPIVIEAKPGAGGMLGTEAAARSAPDGYTLFMANNSTHGSNPAVYAKLPYDAVNDFVPIAFVASVPYVLVLSPSMPVNSVQQLAGLPGFEIVSWFGLLAPAGTPAPIVARLNAETNKALARADVQATLGAQGLEVAPGSPEQFGAHIKSEIAKFARIACGD